MKYFLALIPTINELVKSQGFAVVLMAAVSLWFAYDNHLYRKKMQQEYLELQNEVKICNSQIVEIYREERNKMLQTIDKNTEVLDRLESKLNK